MKPDRDALVWTVPGAVLGFALLSLPSIGLFVLPFAGLFGLVAARATGGRGGYGAAVGWGGVVAAVCLPQAAFAWLGVAGVLVALAGVVACLASHRAQAKATISRATPIGSS